MRKEISLVVPCFNEAARFPVSAWQKFVRQTDIGFLFVNDGSTDATGLLLDSMIAGIPHGRAEILRLSKNVGKAEAVRRGLLHCIESGVHWVGFADADLATPVQELQRIITQILPKAPDVVMASRVCLLGTRIARKRRRHLFGRIFATFASLSLDMPVYDTQCGAKFFRTGDALCEAVKKPFLSRWIFDVELMGRLLTPERSIPLAHSDFLEVPLLAWAEQPGSKLRVSSMLRAAPELLQIAFRLRQARAAWRPPLSSERIDLPSKRAG